MAKSWLAFALLHPHWVIPADTPLPYQFDERVSLQAVPDCTPIPDVVDNLREQVSEKIGYDGSHHCIVIDYETDESPSQLLGQAPGWSPHDDAEQKLRFVHSALWLARPTTLTFTTIVIAEKSGSEWITSTINTYAPTYSSGHVTHSMLRSEDLVTTSNAFKALYYVARDKPVHTAALLTIKALCEPTLEFRSLLIWLAMECLFGPVDGREITFRLSQRVALFLETDRSEAKETFKLVKKCYGIRSKIVHGFNVAKMKDDEFSEFALNSETLLRRSLLTILDAKTTTIGNFDGDDREGYLDGLAFK